MSDAVWEENERKQFKSDGPVVPEIDFSPYAMWASLYITPTGLDRKNLDKRFSSAAF